MRQTGRSAVKMRANAFGRSTGNINLPQSNQINSAGVPNPAKRGFTDFTAKRFHPPVKPNKAV